MPIAKCRMNSAFIRRLAIGTWHFRSLTAPPPGVIIRLSMIHQRKTIRESFEALRGQGGRVGLLPFISAGYPDLATTAAALPALEAGGATAIEIGIPFSDPIADGPTIQESYTAALAKGIRVTDIFHMVRETRAKVSIPLLAMVSYSIAFRYGLKKFLDDAKSCGFDAMLFPDLPPPEAKTVCDLVRSAGLDTVLLIAPSTEPQRRREIAELCSGFVYYLSVAGITGERTTLPQSLPTNLRELRSLTDRPICVGFGISTPQHVADLKGLADGAIVGSAIVKKIKTTTPQTPAAVATELTAYCRQLLSKVK
jgi:tryptophan synthase alpha chain